MVIRCVTGVSDRLFMFKISTKLCFAKQLYALLLLNIEFNNETVILINLYAPTRDNNKGQKQL